MTLNALGLYGIAFVLAAAFAAQLVAGAALSVVPAATHPVRGVGDRTHSQCPLRAAPQPLRLLSLFAAIVGATVAMRQILLHIHARRSRLRLGATGLSLLYLGIHRLRGRDHADRGHAAVRPTVLKTTRPAGAGRRARKHCGVAGGRTDRAERDFDAAGMRLCRLSRTIRSSTSCSSASGRSSFRRTTSCVAFLETGRRRWAEWGRKSKLWESDKCDGISMDSLITARLVRSRRAILLAR